MFILPKLIFFAISSDFPEFLSSSAMSSCSLSNIFWLIFSEVKAIGFEAAICIDNCFPNKSISFDILFEVKDTITANLETLSLITEC